jgi:MoxR-like ATPase
MTNFSSDVEAADALAESYNKLKAEISNVVIGQDEVVRQVLTGIFCQDIPCW